MNRSIIVISDVNQAGDSDRVSERIIFPINKLIG